MTLMYFMAAFYFLAGCNHFRNPGFYRPMMPPYLPWPDLLIAVSGVAEILLGLLLLWKPASPWAAWGIIAMLLAFMTVHIFMYQERNTLFASVPASIIIARIPLQGVLIAWAYWYTR